MVEKAKILRGSFKDVAEFGFEEGFGHGEGYGIGFGLGVGYGYGYEDGYGGGYDYGYGFEDGYGIGGVSESKPEQCGYTKTQPAVTADKNIS